MPNLADVSLTVTFDAEQLQALDALLDLVHSDNLSDSWRGMLPEELRHALDFRIWQRASRVDVGLRLAARGHGHVVPRTDGMKARCGGPAMCKQCGQDLANCTDATRREG